MKFLTCFLINFLILTVSAQVGSFEYHRIIIDSNNLVYNDFLDNGLMVVKSKRNNASESSNPTVLAPILIDVDGNYYKESAFLNHNVVLGFAFDIVFNNRIPESWRNNDSRFKTPESIKKKKYYFECRKLDEHFLPRNSAYDPYSNKLNLDNVDYLSKGEKAVFNYDFQIVEDELFLFIQSGSEFFIYKAESLDNLPEVIWKSTNCIESPFKQEYFICSKVNNETIILRTKTQGEFKLENLNLKPTLTKINDKILGDRIFLEDKRSDSIFELNQDEYKSLISSDEHVQKLNKIIKTKNKR